MSVLKNFPLANGLFFVVFFLSGGLANRNRHLSPRTDWESLEEIQDLLRQEQLAFKMKMESQDLGLKRILVGDEKEDNGDHDIAVNHKQCNCSGVVCSCCRQIRVLRFRQNGCVKLTYEPDKRAMLVTLTFGSRALPPKEVPAIQPSPICGQVPRISRRAAVCIEFYNYKLEDAAVTGCLTLKAKAFGRTLLTIHIGCFKLALRSTIEQVGEVGRPYLKGDSVDGPGPIYPW